MKLTGYPATSAHMAIHSDFAETAANLAQAHEAGSGKTALELADFMQGWLETHINQEDRPLVAHVRAWIGADAASM